MEKGGKRKEYLSCRGGGGDLKEGEGGTKRRREENDDAIEKEESLVTESVRNKEVKPGRASGKKSGRQEERLWMGLGWEDDDGGWGNWGWSQS